MDAARTMIVTAIAYISQPSNDRSSRVKLIIFVVILSFSIGLLT